MQLPPSSSGSPFVVVVQHADLRQSDDFAFLRRLDPTRLGCILLQLQVDAPSMMDSPREIQSALDLPKSTIYRYLARLVENRTVIRSGQTTSIRYRAAHDVVQVNQEVQAPERPDLPIHGD
jgi:hypothetical protein